MPIFEFRCTKCHKDFEKLTSYSKIKDARCPKCHATQVEKKVSTLGGIKIGKAPPSSCPVSQGCPQATACGSGGGCGFGV